MKLKGPFPALFLAKRDNIGREREKKILLTNSVHTRPGQENSKKNAKKLKKLKNPFLTLFWAKMGWDRQGNREKNYTPEFRSFSTRARKFQKKYKKKLKNQFPALFLAKTGSDRPRKGEKILIPNYVPTQPEPEISK